MNDNNELPSIKNLLEHAAAANPEKFFRVVGRETAMKFLGIARTSFSKIQKEIPVYRYDDVKRPMYRLYDLIIFTFNHRFEPGIKIPDVKKPGTAAGARELPPAETIQAYLRGAQ